MLWKYVLWRGTVAATTTDVARSRDPMEKDRQDEEGVGARGCRVHAVPSRAPIGCVARGADAVELSRC